MDFENFLKTVIFEWDHGNIEKNWKKHNVLIHETEEVFFNKPILISPDTKHSYLENRYFSLGKTNDERKLFLVFTIRKDKIRIISTRDMSKNERKNYEEIKENSTI